MYPQNKAKSGLRLFMLGGGTPKEYAYMSGVTPTCVYKWIADVGFRKHFLTEEEGQLIIANRKKLYKCITKS